MAAQAEPVRGTASIPQATSTIPPTAEAELDAALAALVQHKDEWTKIGIPERIHIIDQLVAGMNRVADGWIVEALKAKGISPDAPQAGEEWLAGPFTVMRNLRLLKRSLREIATHGRPLPPGPPKTLPNGQVSVPVFPIETADKLFYTGFTAEIWMEPGVSAADVPKTQAAIYRKKAAGETIDGKVALVLGAGNVASIGPMDALYKLFVEDQVVLLKMNPVNEYTGPFVAEAFKALVDRGFFRVVYGGAQEGAYLCQHDGVDEIHITGSDKTHDAIVFGVGPEGAERKKNRQPVNTRRITSELGNVSPIIVVPGPWKEADLAFQGVNIASSLTNNAGFNCNATRVILTHAGWDQRAALLERVRSTLDQAPTREAYYPGAEQRFDLFTGAHREGAEELGRPRDGHLPWTFIPGLDAAHEDDPCFTTEAFCSVFGELPLEAASPAEYIAKAVEFCNDKLWGTLNAAIVVHPDSLKDPAVAKAVEQAVADLRYGAVAVNHWPALAYALVTTTWGAFPGHDAYDIQSGVGVVHNTFLFDHPQKTVVRGPFRMPLKPPWFVTNKNSHRIARKLYEYEAAPSLWKIPGIVIQSLKG